MENQEVLAEVVDDGRGFDPASVRAGGSLGDAREDRRSGWKDRGEEQARRRYDGYGQGSLGERYSRSSTSMTPPEDEDNLLGPIEDVQLPVDVPTCTEALPLICVLPANESSKGKTSGREPLSRLLRVIVHTLQGLHEGAILPFLGRFHFVPCPALHRIAVPVVSEGCQVK